MSLVLSSVAEFTYKRIEFYQSEYKSGIIGNDSYIDINLPLDDIDEIILSGKDKRTGFKELNIMY